MTEVSDYDRQRGERDEAEATARYPAELQDQEQGRADAGYTDPRYADEAQTSAVESDAVAYPDRAGTDVSGPGGTDVTGSGGTDVTGRNDADVSVREDAATFRQDDADVSRGDDANVTGRNDADVSVREDAATFRRGDADVSRGDDADVTGRNDADVSVRGDADAFRRDEADLSRDRGAAADLDRGATVGDTPTDSREPGLVDDAHALMVQWQEVQVGFVDDPRKALQAADELVQQVIQQVERRFATERDSMEHQWSRGQDVSTEDLRLMLQRYRSLFNRLLHV